MRQRSMVLAAGLCGTVMPLRAELLQVPDIPFTHQGTATTALVQSDGRIVVGGHFSLANGMLVPGYARFHTDGRLDADWRAPVLTQSSSAPQARFVEVRDGALVACGDFTAVNGVPRRGLARLEIDGTLDPTWNPGASSGIAGRCHGIVRMGDSVIAAVGGALHRFNDRTGAAFPGFAYAGPTPLQLSGNASGSVYIVEVGASEWRVRQVSADTGRLEPAWISSGWRQVTAIALDTATASVFVSGSPQDAPYDHEELHKLTDGPTATRDHAWRPALEGYGRFEAMQAMDGILFVRACERRSSICPTLCVHALAPGAIDPRCVRPRTELRWRVLAVQADLSLIETPWYWYQLAVSGVRRRHSDGTIDGGFAADIRSRGSLSKLVVGGDGGVYVAGSFSRAGSVYRHNFAHIAAESHAVDGWATGLWTGSSGYTSNDVTSFVVEDDGTSFVATAYWDDGLTAGAMLTKQSGMGSRDETWGSVWLADAAIRSVELEPHSDWLYVAGSFDDTICGEPRRYLARVSRSGPCRADPRWRPQLDAPVAALARDHAGGLLAGLTYPAGVGAGRPLLVRVLETGEIDPEFASPLHDASHGAVHDILVAPNAIIVSGSFSSLDGAVATKLAKLSLTGALDRLFVVTGDAEVTHVTLGVDGALYATRATVNGSAVHTIDRFDLSLGGASDPVPAAIADGRIHSLASLPGGRIALAGDFATVDGEPRRALAVIEEPPFVLFCNGFDAPMSSAP